MGNIRQMTEPEEEDAVETNPTWPTDESIRFGELVKKLRGRTGRDQTSFGHLLDDYSKSLIGAIERGERPPSPRFLRPLKREFPNDVEAIDSASAPLLQVRTTRVRRPFSAIGVTRLPDAAPADEEPSGSEPVPTPASAPGPSLNASPHSPIPQTEPLSVTAHGEGLVEPEPISAVTPSVQVPLDASSDSPAPEPQALAVTSTAEKRAEQAPDIIDGRYAIERKLGSSSRSEIYLARDTDLGRPVALLVFEGQPYDGEFHAIFHSLATRWFASIEGRDGYPPLYDGGGFRGDAYVVLGFNAATSLEKYAAFDRELMREGQKRTGDL